LYAQAGEELANAEAWTDARLLSLEEQFFAELDSILAQVQKEALKRVRDHRWRARCTVLKSTYLVAGSVDLAAVVEDMGLTSEELPCLEEVLRGYEPEAATLMRRYQEDFRARRGPGSRLSAAMMPNGRAMIMPRATEQELARQWMEYMQLCVTNQRQIADLNGQYISEFMRCIPPERSREFERRCLGRMYPGVHPDVLRADDIVEPLLDDERLTDDTRQALAAILEQRREAYEKICRHMRAQFNESRVSKMLEITIPESTRATLQSSLRALRDERWNLSRQLIEETVSLLPPDMRAEFQAAHDQYRARFKAVWERSREDNFPGPS
jgi:hypothetical protein